MGVRRKKQAVGQNAVAGALQDKSLEELFSTKRAVIVKGNAHPGIGAHQVAAYACVRSQHLEPSSHLGPDSRKTLDYRLVLQRL
jgi:hypothetical protein